KPHNALERFRERAELAINIYNSWKSVLEEEAPPDGKANNSPGMDVDDRPRKIRRQDEGQSSSDSMPKKGRPRAQTSRKKNGSAGGRRRTDGYRGAIRYPAQDDRMCLPDSSRDEETGLTRERPA
ncbi:hypothetical protein FRB99_004075, partial [Tulasnella sp. 403]